MALKISTSTLFSRHYLVLKRDGIKFYDNNFLGARSFKFHAIGCVMMSAEHVLSFQVGREVFSIPTKPGNAKHEAALAALLAGLEASRLPPGSAVRYS